MSSKKSTSKKSNRERAAQPRKRAGIVVIHTSDNDGLTLNDEGRSNGQRRKQPYQLNPESTEEREKRLAARKALTLKAFRIAYDNHHRRKPS